MRNLNYARSALDKVTADRLRVQEHDSDVDPVTHIWNRETIAILALRALVEELEEIRDSVA